MTCRWTTRAGRPGRVRRDAGETLIEVALTMALFLMTLLGTAQFGLMVFHYNIVSNLAQEGARRASVCGRGRSLALNCNIADFVRSRSLGLNPTVTITGINDTTRTCTTTTVNPNLLPAGSGVCVSVQKPFARMTRIIPMASSLTLRSTAQMIVSR